MKYAGIVALVLLIAFLVTGAACNGLLAACNTRV